VLGLRLRAAIKAGEERVLAFEERAEAMGLTARGPVMDLFLGLPRSVATEFFRHGQCVAGLMDDPYGLAAFGKGLYLTRYASKAHHYTAGDDWLVLCRVALGHNETVMTRDPARSSLQHGVDSILVPGRRLPMQAPSREEESTSEAGLFAEEYVVFDLAQVLPLYLIRYSTDSL